MLSSRWNVLLHQETSIQQSAIFDLQCHHPHFRFRLDRGCRKVSADDLGSEVRAFATSRLISHRSSLSVCAGLVNGSVFNIVCVFYLRTTSFVRSTVRSPSPGILSSIWGIQNLGRNFGVFVFSPLIGTPAFSLLYSCIAAGHTNGGICEGVHCWRLTFWIIAGCGVVAFSLSLLLWRRWKDRV